MFNEKLKRKLEVEETKKPIKYNFKFLVDTTVSVFNLDNIVNNNDILEKIYWARDNLGGVDMSKTLYYKDLDVIKTWHSDWNLHKQTDIFDNLIKIVEDRVLESIGKHEERDAKVRECWAMINKKGDRIVNHKHFDHGYSAVYYALADENANPLIFADHLTITPISNMLVCFPGYLTHHVPVLKTDQQRVLMSFNLWCSG